jgi:hypothetical protein
MENNKLGKSFQLKEFDYTLEFITYLSISIFCIGIMFKYMLFPGGGFMINFGGLGISLCIFFIGFSKYTRRKTKNEFNKWIEKELQKRRIEQKMELNPQLEQDRILDKILSTGYESLTKEEKSFLDRFKNKG